MTGKTLFIINPMAGGATRAKELGLLKEKIAAIPNYYCQITNHQGHAIEIVKAARGSYNKMVAVGGDGTVNEIAGELAGSGITMGIIPFGSGNGLAHHLKIPVKWQDALAVVENNSPKPIDIITVNNRIVINVGGMGFDGHVAKIFNASTNRGNFNYMRIILQELIHYKEFPFTINTSEQSIKGKAFIMAIANGTEFGNRFKIAPESRHNDGLFNLIVVKKPPFLKLLYLMLQGFKGKLKPSKYYQDYPLTEAEITFDNTIVHVDGEIDEPSLASPLQLRIKKHALNICY